MAKLTDEKLIQELMDEFGWPRDETINGYVAIRIDCANDYEIDGAYEIERIDDLFHSDKFDYGITDDWSACRQAENDGVKFINDINGLEKGRYIDTPENRKHCEQYINEHPDVKIDNWLFDDKITDWFRETYIDKFGDSGNQ